VVKNKTIKSHTVSMDNFLSDLADNTPNDKQFEGVQLEDNSEDYELQEVEEDLSGGITFKYLKKEVTEKKK
jgi:hypothetical protein